MKINIAELKRVIPIAKRRAARLIVSFINALFRDKRLKKDLFNSDYIKKTLICYLPEAFDNKTLPKSHTNFTECYTAAKVFHRLGYSVDCASRDMDKIDYSLYDVVYGITSVSFAGSFKTNVRKEPLRIFYSVGAQTFFNFRVTAERNLSFHRQHHKWLLSSNHYIPGNGMNHYNAMFSDAVISLGNRYVVDRFLLEDERTDRYYHLPAFYFSTQKVSLNKDIPSTRKSILWFGSSGLIHKGLDIAIDFALKHPHYQLHICGASRAESEFWQYYDPLVTKASNIINHGFVNIECQRFSSILQSCALLINPSLSESGATAVLNVLGNGVLLPIYSKATGLDLSEHGVEVENVNYKSFEQAILGVETWSDDILLDKAQRIHKIVSQNYSLSQYEENLTRHIETILKKNK